jgi:hypothetical protein
LRAEEKAGSVCGEEKAVDKEDVEDEADEECRVVIGSAFPTLAGHGGVDPADIQQEDRCGHGKFAEEDSAPAAHQATAIARRIQQIQVVVS